jgi:hypothetical protein
MSFLAYYKKIRGPEETAFRLRQKGWNILDRIKNFRLPGSPNRFNFEREDGSPQMLFFKADDSQQMIKRFVELFPHSRRKIVHEADNICENSFSVLGYKNLSFGDNGDINWHLDPTNKKVSPLIWWQKIDSSDNEAIGDPKVIWELNRHQYFLLLGLAYRLSGDIKYKERLFFLLNSWFTSNPPKKGINWASSIELAFRAIAWIWTYHLLNGENEFPRKLLSTLLGFLHLQAEHIAHNLSTYFSPNTHLTGEALGLFYLGLFLAGDRKAENWAATGKQILLEQLPRHVLEDGGYVERSLWYHRYTVDIYLHFYLLARASNINLPENVETALESLGEFLIYSSRPDRTIPLIGDDDGGRLLPLDRLKAADLRGLFSTLSVIFRRGDFKYLSHGYQEETFWLLGPDSKEVYDNIIPHEPRSISKGFKKTGYFFMRDNWSESANYLAFDCGSHGWLNCGHAHADLLSFQIVSGGQAIVVDPGTYTYCGALRDHFRGTECHATVKVDGFSPAITDGLFKWKLTPEHELLDWRTSKTYDYVAGRMKSDTNWTHLREIFFIKPHLFLISDSLEGDGKHTVEIRFPLFGREWNVVGNKCLSKDDSKPFSIECVNNKNLNPQLVDSWFSPVYGQKIPGYDLVFKGLLEFPCKLGFLINPSENACNVEFSEGAGDSKFKIFSKRTNSEIFAYGIVARET